MRSSRPHAAHAGMLGTGGGAAGARGHARPKHQPLLPVVLSLSQSSQESFSLDADSNKLATQPTSSTEGPSAPPAAGSGQQQQQQADWGAKQKTTSLLAAAAAAAAAASSAGNAARATAAVLGSPPGVTWHYKKRGRHVNGSNGAASTDSGSNNGNFDSYSSLASADETDWTVRYAAETILSALDSSSIDHPASSPASSSSGAVPAGSVSDAAAPGTAAVSRTTAEQREADALLQGQGEQQQRQDLVMPEFSLFERRASHASASSSGRDAAQQPISSSNTSRGVAQQQQQRQESLSLTDEELIWMQQGPAANFRDPRFEQALSRWIIEAPDWYKVRTVYERFGWRFNIINLACCFSKLADLFEPLANRRMLRKERAALKRFVQQLLQDTAALLPSVDGGTATALLSSWARLAACGKVRHSPQLVSSLLQHVAPQLSRMKPKELAGTLWALSRLKQPPREGWLDCLFDSTQQTLPQLRANEVPVLVRGLAGVQAQPPPQPWLSALLAHAEAQLEIMEPQQIAMLLIGLANMQVRPSRSWMDAVMAALRTKFDTMGPQSLSNVLWALSLMGCLPDRSWLAAYFNTTLLLLNSFNPKELAVGMWAISRARLEPSDEWLDEYFDQSEAKLTGFSLRDVCLCGYSLAKLGLRPPQTWLRRYCTLLLRLKAGFWHQKPLLTQALVALDSFKVPRMDMWRRELYAAAGYKLYSYTDWRQRVKVPQAPPPVPFSSRRSFGRFGRRGRGVGSSVDGVMVGARPGFRAGGDQVGSKQGIGGVPVALRSGDWGVMDFGGLGSMMSSYEELGSSSSNGAAAASAAASSDSVSNSSSNSSSASAISSRDEIANGRDAVSRTGATAAGPAAAAVQPASPPQGWSSRPAAVSPRPLKGAGLVRPAPPVAAGTAAAPAEGPTTGAPLQQTGGLTDVYSS